METGSRLDDGFTSMSRRQIRQLRREFARLDRLRERGGVPAPRSAPEGPTAFDEAEQVRAAVSRLRIGVALLLLLSVVVLMRAVLPAVAAGPSGVTGPPATPPSSSVPGGGGLGPATPTEPEHPSIDWPYGV